MNTTMPWTVATLDICYIYIIIYKYLCSIIIYVTYVYSSAYICILYIIYNMYTPPHCIIKRACINNSYSLTYVGRSEDVCHEDSECAAHLTGYSKPTSSG